MDRAVRAKTVDSSKRGAVNNGYYMGKTRDKARGDFGRNPLRSGQE
jgi:hypothetical protein